MSSSAAASSPAPKNIHQATPANYSQGPVTNALESSQKRSGSSGSFAWGSAARSSPQGRKDQPLRKPHKAQRRARLADEDAIAESAAMKSINSRKGQTSITHLMNFTLPPRPYFQHQHHASNYRHQRRNPTWGLGSGYHAIDKARYVHANYRFIVRPDREYHAQAVDADVYVGWEAVLQVLASAETQSASCPICLSTPVAPRMARCGHIFCLPCLIRYMHSTDDTTTVQEKRARWKKCPICEDSIYISETRPVRWFVGQEASMLREGGDVLLKLVMREPGTTLALPRDASESYGDREDIPWYNIAEIMDYARFMKGGEQYMLSQYNHEIIELETQEKEDELMFGDDTTWSRKAVAAVTEAKEKLKGVGDPPNSQNERKPPRDPIVFNNASEVPEMYNQHRAATSGQSLPSAPADARVTSPTLNTTQSRNTASTTPFRKLTIATNRLSLETAEKPTASASPQIHATTHLNPARPPNHPFFFYHALPNFFLSALDIRILKVAFGDFSSFPTSILPRVEHISTGHIVDDDLRKRAKYMAHLPYGCEVSFLECDWTDIIPEQVLSQFAADILRRRKRNHEKEAREERERVRAEKEEDDKRWAAARRRRPSFGGAGKSFSETDFVPLAHHDDHLASSLPDQNTISSSPPWGNYNARTHSSFASLATPGTSPEAPRTVWGTTAIPSSSPQLVAQHQNQDLPADDGWLQGWEKDLLDQPGDNVALVEASLNGNGEGGSRSASVTGGGKKKKGKKITLMSTNARRGA